MHFRLDDENPYWIAEAPLRGQRVLVRLETDDEIAGDAALVGQRILDHVHLNWGLIQDTLVNELLSVHNDQWADPDRSRPKLTRDDFLGKLVPKTIDFGTWEEDGILRERCSVMLDDSGIFGGHAVQVYWNSAVAAISPNASIEG